MTHIARSLALTAVALAIWPLLVLSACLLAMGCTSVAVAQAMAALWRRP